MLRVNKKFHLSESNGILERLFEIIEDTIIRGQSEHLFKKDLDLDVCRNLLFGTLDHILIPWIMFNRHYDLKSVGEEASRLFVNALKNG